MQVSQTHDYATHAAVGVGQVTAFGISQSAEFFRVLSESLYSDKPRAMVREILCNAWDSHIASGCTDLPIKVTISEDYFIVEDGGSGIAPEMMGPIYCTYGGGSTKTHDGKQTGGFSLGSKAPFAFSEHFEVQSCFAGTKTIYNLSLASVAADGLPACQTIVSLPTSETGLRVTVPIKFSDRHVLQKLVKEIAEFGEMNVVLDGTPCRVIPFSKSPAGFVVTDKIQAGAYVRYGAVAYKIPPHDQYDSLLERARELASKSGQHYNGWESALVLQAEPNTIAVTPSRESLSMTDQTIETITGLLTKFLAAVAREHAEARIEAVISGIDKCWMHVGFDQLFRSKLFVPNQDMAWKSSVGAGDIFEPRLLAIRHFYVMLGGSNELLQKSMLLRLRSIVASGHDRTNLARTLSKHILKHGTINYFRWFQRSVLLPIHRKLSNYPKLKLERLYVTEYSPYHGLSVTRVPKVGGRGFSSPLEFTRGLAVISYNRLDVNERLPKFPIMKFRYGSVGGLLVYTVPRHQPEHIEQARAMFQSLGYTVIDLTVRQKWEPKPTREPAIRAAPRPRTTGYVKLSALKDVNQDASTIIEDTATDRHGKPEFVVKMTPALQDDFTLRRYLKGYSVKSTQLILELFGEDGGIATTQTTYDKAIEEGALPLVDFLNQWLIETLAKDTSYQRRRAHRAVFDTREYRRLDFNTQGLIDLVYEDQALMKHFGVWQDRTDIQKSADVILQELAGQVGTSKSKLCTTLLGEVKPTAAATKLLKMVSLCGRADVIQTQTIRHSLRIGGNEDYLASLRKLVITAIKG